MYSKTYINTKQLDAKFVSKIIPLFVAFNGFNDKCAIGILLCEKVY